MADIPAPQQGEMQIVVLIDDATFIGTAPYADVDKLMDSFETLAKLRPTDRTSMERQMMMRIEVAKRLRGDRAEELFREFMASAALWLCFRHYSSAAQMRKGLDRQMDEAGSAVVTVSIGESKGALPDTSWGLMIGDRIHDARERLASQEHSKVVVIERLEDGELSETQVLRP